MYDIAEIQNTVIKITGHKNPERVYNIRAEKLRNVKTRIAKIIPASRKPGCPYCGKHGKRYFIRRHDYILASMRKSNDVTIGGGLFPLKNERNVFRAI